jgi:hypothetical protein
VLSILAVVAIWQADIYHLKARVAETSFPIGEVPIGQLLHASKLTGFYTLLGFMGATFTAITLLLEFYRATPAFARRARGRPSRLRSRASSARTAGGTAATSRTSVLRRFFSVSSARA